MAKKIARARGRRAVDREADRDPRGVVGVGDSHRFPAAPRSTDCRCLASDRRRLYVLYLAGHRRTELGLTRAQRFWLLAVVSSLVAIAMYQPYWTS